ncbi:MAG TPA: DUF5715 family protein [Longimicrobium sp.]|nr:DUF5715 family protein [Longimicrobium sp.]
MRSWMAMGLAGVLALGACGRSGHRDFADAEREEPPRAAAPARPAPPAPEDSAAVAARVAAAEDSVRRAFQQVRKLRWREVWGLRRDKNAEQIAIAQSLGIRVSGEQEIQRLVRAGRLVPLGDSTEHWVLRRMEHSVPYATPDTRAMLLELGRRFHQRLDSLGLPRYRMKITSVLRTDETQAELRKVNPNASQTVSAHEFGTTLDVSHQRFAAPADPEGAAAAGWEVESEMLDSLGVRNFQALQAELGRAIAELRRQGALRVMMEDRQPVYHMTVARRFGGRSAAAGTRR